MAYAFNKNCLFGIYFLPFPAKKSESMVWYAD